MNLTSNLLTNTNKNENVNDTNVNDTNGNDTNGNKDPEYFGNGEFEFIKNDSREYLVSAHKILTRLELWNWLRNFTPEDGKGFMFTEGVPELDRLNEEMSDEKPSHFFILS